MDYGTPVFPVLHYLPEFAEFMAIKSMMPSNHLILCRSLLLLPSIFPSIRVLSNELILCIRWPKYLSFSFSISLSNEYSGLISFRIDCFAVLAVQGTLKSLLQHPNSEKSIVWCSAWRAAVYGVTQSQTRLKRLSSSSLLYGPTLTSVHDYWKNHSFDYMDLCRQSDVSAF